MVLFALFSPIIFVVVVSILGFITPGYSHINHTISRLAIMQYGWIQTLNFLQLAIGYLLIGDRIARTMTKEDSRRIIRVFFSFSAAILVLAALAPTDPIDNIRFAFSLLTPTGFIHSGSVFSFLLVSPIVVSRLYKALQNEPSYRRYARLSGIIGAFACFASLVWVLLFFNGILLEYRGILQKLIVLLSIVWIIFIHTIAIKSTNAS